MSVLGSVKNRLKTMFIINKNRKLKLSREKINKKKENTINLKVKDLEIKPVYVLRKVKINKIELSAPIIVKKSGKKKEHDEPLKIKKLNISKNNNLKVKPKDELASKYDILRRFKIFVKDSKEEIKELKKDIKKEEENLKIIKNEKQIEEYHKRLEVIKDKINHLKNLYDALLDKYNFEGFEEINDALLASYIDDFKFIHSGDEIDLLVNECIEKLDYLDDVNDLFSKINKLEEKETSKKQKIEYLNRDYYNRVIDYDKLISVNDKIDRYMLKEKEYLDNLEKEINNNTIDTKITTKLKFDRNYINNLCKINIGLNCFNKTFIGAFVGAFLIKNSLTPLLMRAFKREEVIKYSYRYEEYSKKISDNLSIVKQTSFLLKDSLRDVNILKRYMEMEYKDYLKAEEYNKLYNKIIKLEKNLIKKRENTIILENKLLEQKRKSHEKQKKLESLYSK